MLRRSPLRMTAASAAVNDQYVMKLREEPLPRRGCLLSSELVATVNFKSRVDLGVG